MDNTPYRWPLIQAAVTQVIFFFASGCMVDRGALTLTCVIVAAPFWIAAFCISGILPSRMRLLFVRWGLIPITLAGVALIYPLVWYFR